MIAYAEFEPVKDPKIEKFNEQFPCLFFYDLRLTGCLLQPDDGRFHFTHSKTGEPFTWNALKNTWETTRYKWSKEDGLQKADWAPKSGRGWNGEGGA
jgi:hypothetical protein